MNDILVSIVTITFNAAEEIRPTLMSVRNQILPDRFKGAVEHLIIDGASEDDTIGIAGREGIEGIRIVSEPDKGLYDAMNKGLRLAKGDYILFLNAGDTFHAPTDLAAYMEGAAAGFDIIYGDTLIVDAGRKVIGPRHLSVPERLTRRSLMRGMLVCHQALMVRRALAPEYDTAYRFSADYDWEVKCVGKTTPDRCLNLARPVIEYLSDGLTDRNKIPSLKERFHIMAKHYGLLPTVAGHVYFVARLGCRKLFPQKSNCKA